MVFLRYGGVQKNDVLLRKGQKIAAGLYTSGVVSMFCVVGICFAFLSLCVKCHPFLPTQLYGGDRK